MTGQSCATAGCYHGNLTYFESGGVGSWYCSVCYPKVLRIVGRERVEKAVAAERAAAVQFLRHWASLSGAFEDIDGRDLIYQFAKRLEDGEHLLPPGVTTQRDPSGDNPGSHAQSKDRRHAR